MITETNTAQSTIIKYVGQEWCKPDNNFVYTNEVYVDTVHTGRLVLCRVERLYQGDLLSVRRVPLAYNELNTVG